MRLVGGEPLEQLSQFADLPDQREGERFGVVEPSPVSLVSETAHAVAEVCQIAHGPTLPDTPVRRASALEC